MPQNEIRNMVFSLFDGEQAASPLSEFDTLRTDNILMRAVINNFPGGIALYDADLRLVLCNDTLKTMLEYPEDLFAFGRPTMEQVFRFNAMRGEYGKGDVEQMVQHRLELARQKKPHVYERTRPNGLVVEVRGAPLPGGGFVTTYLDVTEKRMNAQVDIHATEENLDPETGLATLAELKQKIDEASRNLAPNAGFCVHYLDIDEFRMFRHMHGSRLADWVIKEVSNRIRNLIRQGDVVARAGNDKFVILQSNLSRPSDVARLAGRVVDAVRQPIWCGDKSLFVGCSVGFALVPRDGRDAEALINKAQASLMTSRKTVVPETPEAA